MLDVAEENVDLTATMITVTKTVLMNLYFPRNSFAVESRPNEYVIKIDWLST